MNAYTFMIIALGAGIIYMGMRLMQRIREMQSAPDDEETSQRSDVQQLLRKHLEENDQGPEPPEQP